MHIKEDMFACKRVSQNNTILPNVHYKFTIVQKIQYLIENNFRVLQVYSKEKKQDSI